jgi:CRP-like cAMP-binding protein
MNDLELVEALRDIDFLAGVGDETLKSIASVAQLVEFPEGQVIFHEGEPAKDIYLIIRGDVSLEICAAGIGCRRMYSAGPGELLAWSPVLEQPRLSSTARAVTSTQAVKINGTQILTLCEHDPRFGYEFMRRAAGALVKRLNAAQVQLLDIYGPESPATDKG